MITIIFVAKVPVDIMEGLSDKDARWLADKLEFTGNLQEQVNVSPSCYGGDIARGCKYVVYFSHFFFQQQAAQQIKRLYKLFLNVDATQVEINPFGLTPDGKGANKLNMYINAFNGFTLNVQICFINNSSGML